MHIQVSVSNAPTWNGKVLATVATSGETMSIRDFVFWMFLNPCNALRISVLFG